MNRSGSVSPHKKRVVFGREKGSERNTQTGRDGDGDDIWRLLHEKSAEEHHTRSNAFYAQGKNNSKKNLDQPTQVNNIKSHPLTKTDNDNRSRPRPLQSLHLTPP